MAKIIKYSLCIKKPRETESGIVYDEVLIPTEIRCETEAVFTANLPIAQKEACGGEITVEGEYEPEKEPSDKERITVLEEAMELLLSGVTE